MSVQEASEEDFSKLENVDDSTEEIEQMEAGDLSEESGVPLDTVFIGNSEENDEQVESGEDNISVNIENEIDILNKELDNVKLPPSDLVSQFASHKEKFDPQDFPFSYKENTSKERLALSFAENFSRQYVHLYRDRKKLLLAPLNECGVEKFVCTTLSPTKLPYKELYDWEGAASFVAEYLEYVRLEPPTEIPERLLAPQTTLEIQKGTSFEYSQLLVSLLIGAGYDAYVVSGYATRECCYMDETREICPLLKPNVAHNADRPTAKTNRYTVRPPKDLRSKFELKQEARKIAAEKEAAAKQIRQEEQRELEAERPAHDPLFGQRVHAWVLVLAGKREVPDSFFIETLTGMAHSLTSHMYVGIESLWNNKNYWVNMQDCSEGLEKIQFDLGNCTMWEFMFPSNDKPLLTLPDQDDGYEDEDDNKINDAEIEKHLDIPHSWTKPITLSRQNYEMRCPLGRKTKLYKRAKLEKFTPYLLPDGLVTRLTMYHDRELKEINEIREYFENRADKLKLRVNNYISGKVNEYFEPGRQAHLKHHSYLAATPGPHSERFFIFYNEARVDGLVRREEKELEITEHFIDRQDRLLYRHVTFSRRQPKMFGPADADTTTKKERAIEQIVERFGRNKEMKANDDVAEIVYICTDDRIHMTYHTDNDKVSASTREYIKPPKNNNKGGALIMQSDTHLTFQVDPTSRQKKNVEVYELLLRLIEMETASKQACRNSEEETRAILDSRGFEEANCTLEISLFDTKRNDKAKRHRQELEQQLEEERLRRQEIELDYLAPFLAKMNEPQDPISKEQAFELREYCLKDFKQRLINKANLIQARFEKETKDLQQKQQWYQRNQVQMNKEDEEEYLGYCSEAMFRIQILEQMLARHKQTAPYRYKELETKLRNDQRLKELYTTV